ncbi:hypothetical protein [Streptomyces soliscabiei]|uniref:hypothetical protein n=1 Tax=Streptomyces soliscabiei TaxID=588897 RepID=UPI0029B0B6F7|nr:hypothetical protein [Streptomyces sp. NY05-11A]MDX2678551.1 hypothetical protein [Streptomyces sp. NY05-11A]
MSSTTSEPVAPGAGCVVALDPEVDPEEPQWHPGMLHHGLRSLPVRTARRCPWATRRQRGETP